MWEKFYEPFPETQPNAPFANNEKVDSLEQNPVSDNDEDGDNDEVYETDSDATSSISKSISKLNINKQSKPWEDPMTHDQLKIILNDDNNFSEVKRSLKKDFSRQGLRWKNEEEEVRPWHFGLTSIDLKFKKPQTIDLQMLLFSSPIPFWIKLKTEKQQNTPKNSTPKKANFYRLPSDSDISLCYGALTNLNQFSYSPQHSWKEDLSNKENSMRFFFLDNERDGGYIEWVIQNSRIRRKKQLLLTNINHCVIVDPYPEGFDIYICQKCNLNEFEANANENRNNNNNSHKTGSEQKNSNRSRDSSRHAEKPRSYSRPNSKPRNAPLLCPQKNNPRQPQRVFYEHYHRIGQRADCYFPTVQFSLRINPLRLTNNNSRNSPKQTLAILIEFFLAHKITVCYGKINSDRGPDPYLFFQPNLPNFPTPIMKYSWQILSSVGYRLQLQINQKNFLKELLQLSTEKNNPDELFYRVCVYLSRIFTLKPFLNINKELQHAVQESKRKRDESAYGLVRKIDVGGDNEAYIPSVTITPTTIRIKPLKLCRTNRVLRAVKQFGGALEHFALVDIRDENHQNLKPFYFRDLRIFLLGYLENGFTLMGDGRKYEYLHHSQSQLRARQFWFYHHDKEQPNLSCFDAYRWMGNFDGEKNPAKHAARIALCFSTTKATVQVKI